MSTAADRIKQADDEAYASVSAWMLGPDRFLEFLKAKNEKELAKYATTNDIAEPTAEGNATGSGGTGGGAGPPLAGDGGLSEASERQPRGTG